MATVDIMLQANADNTCVSSVLVTAIQCKGIESTLASTVSKCSGALS